MTYFRTERTRPYLMAHEMTIEEARGEVMKDLIADYEESQLLARTETRQWLKSRLFDFLVYLHMTVEDDIFEGDTKDALPRFQLLADEYVEGVEDAEGMESFDVPGWVPAALPDPQVVSYPEVLTGESLDEAYDGRTNWLS